MLSPRRLLSSWSSSRRWASVPKKLSTTQRKLPETDCFSVAQIYEYAMLPEHMESPDPTVGPSYITETGALSCSSGLRTGRVPKDKRIVEDAETKDVSDGRI